MTILPGLLETYWEQQQDPKDLLHNLRKKSWDHFLELGWPHKSREAFQYLSLQKIVFPKLSNSKTLENVSEYLLPNCAGHLVFVDGFFDMALSSIPPSFICLPLSVAMRSYGLFIQNRAMKTLKEEKDPLAVLNGALQGSAAFLYIPPKTRVAEPIQILQVSTCEEMASPRLEIFVGKEASLELIQTAACQKKTAYSNSVIDAVLDEGSDLSLCDAQVLPRGAIHFQALRASLKKDSRLKTRFFTTGAAIYRHSLKVQLMEENAEVLLQGLCTLDGDAEAHIHATIDHQAPHTRSRQHLKCVLKEKSRSSFEGKIVVQPIAQKTEAYQLNNNLILSDEASGYAKPNLEVFADDVKASHGATTGQLDSEQLFYLCSRGLDFEEAKKWLVRGFCKELIDQAPAVIQRLLFYA
jgi:Fe-S cluster assembly protein SufD